MILIGYLTLFIFGLLDNLRAPEFLTLVHDLNLSQFEGSLFFASTSIFCFVMGLFMSRLVRRFGTLKVVSVGLSFIGCSYFGLSFAHNLFEMMCGASVFGLGFGILIIGQNLLILEAGETHHHRRLLSGLHSMYALSAICAPLVAQAFSFLSWREIFRGVSFLPLILSGFIFLKKPHLPKLRLEQSVLRLPSHRYFIILMVSAYQIAEVSLTTRLASFFEIQVGWSLGYSRLCLFLFFVVLFIGRLLLTLKSKWQVHQIFFVCGFLSFLSSGFALYISPYFFILCGLTMAALFPLAFEWIGSLYPQEQDRLISQALSWGALSIVGMQLLIGFLTDHFSLQTALLVCPIGFLIATCAALKVYADTKTILKGQAIAI